MKLVSLADLTFADFAAALKTKFRVNTSADAAVDFILTEAKSTSAAGSSDPNPKQFSLVFTGPLASCLEQRTYRFEHDTLGTFDLFIVPVGRDSGRFHYEAVFNS